MTPWTFSLQILENLTQKYILCPSARLFYRFVSFINFESSTFIQTYFKTGNIFEAKTDFIKELACPVYCSSNLIWAFYLIPEVSFASHLKMLPGTALNAAFISVLTVLIYLNIWFAFWWTNQENTSRRRLGMWTMSWVEFK